MTEGHVTYSLAQDTAEAVKLARAHLAIVDSLNEPETQSAFEALPVTVLSRALVALAGRMSLLPLHEVSVMTAGDLRIRDQIHVTWRGKVVNLTLGEIKMLSLMASQAGQVVEHRKMYNAVRAEGFHVGCDAEAYKMNVRTFVKRIKFKFRELDRNFDRIEAHRGLGYSWRAE